LKKRKNRCNKSNGVTIPANGEPVTAVTPLTRQRRPNPFVNFSNPTNSQRITDARETKVAANKIPQND